MLNHDFIPSHITVKAAPVNLTGRTFGMLTVIRVVGKAKTNSLLWKCSCSCGVQIDVKSSCLVRGSKRSCGCDQARSRAQIARFAREPSWNKGTNYQIKTDNEEYANKSAWTRAAIKKFGNRCQRCGWSEARCDVHHKTPRHQGGLNTLTNAEVLCPNCHRVHHDTER